MPIETVTVNRYHVKWNAENPHSKPKPTICVNRYEWCRLIKSPNGRDVILRHWGNKIGETEHYFEYATDKGVFITDPVNKTPCDATCWFETTVSRYNQAYIRRVVAEKLVC